jgi:hypothetical protein
MISFHMASSIELRTILYQIRTILYLCYSKKRSILSFSETSKGQDWKFARENFVSNLLESLLKYPDDDVWNRILSSWLQFNQNIEFQSPCKELALKWIIRLNYMLSSPIMPPNFKTAVTDRRDFYDKFLYDS